VFSSSFEFAAADCPNNRPIIRLVAPGRLALIVLLLQTFPLVPMTSEATVGVVSRLGMEEPFHFETGAEDAAF